MDKKENIREIEREEYFVKLKKQLGITLVALVITIIILLIISGIVIAQLTNNGIIGKSLGAKQKYENAQSLENDILTNYGKDYEIDKVASTREEISAPVGTVISCIRSTAPEGYLICDGTEYDISKYSELAEELKKVYGNYNTETAGKFKVPDLRGEFLRGTGTNSYADQGNGANVGTHQDGTEHHSTFSHSNGTLGGALNTGANAKPNMGKVDSTILEANQGEWMTKTEAKTGTNYSNVAVFTSRPTNTSVLYCIKY